MKVLLVGACGYGTYLLNFFKKYGRDYDLEINGIVDPFAQNSPDIDWIKENNILIYNTVGEFFATNTCDFALIASPPYFHKAQAEECMKNGVNVLCEKPLAPVVNDVFSLIKAEEKYNKKIAVGFQWSYCLGFENLKKDILDGNYGKLKRMRVLLSWPRDDTYYTESSWKGRIKTVTGEEIYDSILTNATAHYMHNMLFIAGEKMDEAAQPLSIRAEVYRVKEIETYDTCFIKCLLSNGVELMYISSHSTDKNESPQLIYEFEKGTITLVDDVLTGEKSSGERIQYGIVSGDVPQCDYRKIIAMKNYVERGQPLNCVAKTVVPHGLICQAIYDKGVVHSFPHNSIINEKGLTYVPGLREAMHQCFDEFLLPSEKGLSWSCKPDTITL